MDARDAPPPGTEFSLHRGRVAEQAREQLWLVRIGGDFSKIERMVELARTSRTNSRSPSSASREKASPPTREEKRVRELAGVRPSGATVVWSCATRPTAGRVGFAAAGPANLELGCVEWSTGILGAIQICRVDDWSTR